MHLNIFKKKAKQQKRELSMREKKHQANLRKNGGLHFQIGLIVTLFVVFGVFQLKFEKKDYVADVPELKTDEIEDVRYVDYVIEKPKEVKVEEPKVETKRPTDITNVDVVPDDTPIKDSPLDVKPVVVDKAPAIGDIDVIETTDEIEPIVLNLVQELPVFPGCEKFSDKKKQMECFSKKIAKHINKKFDSEVAAENGITGKQKIFVSFVIDKNGEIADVKARAPHKALEKEALGAVNSLPKMKPAKQGYKKVPVRYSLPISFQVNN